MSEELKPVHAGDLAEYTGDHAPLRGARCLIDSWAPRRTRVRAVFRLNGCEVLRLVKPGNLKRLWGGVLENREE